MLDALVRIVIFVGIIASTATNALLGFGIAVGVVLIIGAYQKRIDDLLKRRRVPHE